MNKDISVIIPTYNEKENIRELLPKILAAYPDMEILIIDDNSPDGTAQVVTGLLAQEPRIHLLERPGKMGLGSAYLAGFKWALARDYQLVFEMDADFSHDPEYIKDFLWAMADYDLVIGSRYLHGEIRVVNWPLTRLFISQAANWYVHFITGLPVADSTSGFKCFRRAVLEKIALGRIHSEGYSFQVEMNFLACQNGFRIKEIPIIFNDRISGRSKLDRHSVWEMVWLVWWLRLKTFFQRPSQ
jgi:dolichol-phosphate mannosyltransferase